ncbi:MAG: CoA ester lyase [Magnetococcus sp. WYHC-3]
MVSQSQHPFSLRSVLYVPGSNQRALAKTAELSMDAIIIDLEDSIAPGAKDSARQNTRQFLQDRLPPVGSQRPLCLTVRVNAQGSPWLEADLAAMAGLGIHAVVLPKVDNREQVEDIARRLGSLESGQKTPPPGLWAMIESPQGVVNAHAIATHPRVDALVMGTSDLAKSLLPLVDSGNQPDGRRPALHFALQQVVLAARAAGVQVMDGVFTDLSDDVAFVNQCREGAMLGFDGKTVIHPRQIDTANRAFSPSPEEYERAKIILEGWNNAHAKGEEICVVNGRLVERLHALQAQRIVTLFESLGTR